MLIPIGELDEINKAVCQNSGWIGLDLTNGNYIRKASEPGNGMKGMYIMHVRNAMALVIWAADDQEAIDKVNYISRNVLGNRYEFGFYFIGDPKIDSND